MEWIVTEDAVVPGEPKSRSHGELSDAFSHYAPPRIEDQAVRQPLAAIFRGLSVVNTVYFTIAPVRS